MDALASAAVTRVETGQGVRSRNVSWRGSWSDFAQRPIVKSNFENSYVFRDVRNIPISATAASGRMRGCRTIRNDKDAGMILQRTLIGQTGSPSKRSTSCSAG